MVFLFNLHVILVRRSKIRCVHSVGLVSLTLILFLARLCKNLDRNLEQNFSQNIYQNVKKMLLNLSLKLGSEE